MLLSICLIASFLPLYALCLHAVLWPNRTASALASSPMSCVLTDPYIYWLYQRRPKIWIESAESRILAIAQSTEIDWILYREKCTHAARIQQTNMLAVLLCPPWTGQSKTLVNFWGFRPHPILRQHRKKVPHHGCLGVINVWNCKVLGSQ
jgi:hypothetical protein